jgi:AcrR family transcriptional regulator
VSAADVLAEAPVPGSVAWWAERQARLARRRPRADGLTIERIVEEAVAIVDDEGLDALTVRRLAARFDTGSATLYRHVASRDELLVLIVDHVLGEVDVTATGTGPRARVEALAGELRRVLLRHPNLVPALPSAPLQGPNAVRGSELSVAAMLESGFPIELAITGYLVLLDYVLGSVFFDSAHLDRHGEVHGTTAEGPDPLGDQVRRTLEGMGSEGVFRYGLQTFLDGLEARARA